MKNVRIFLLLALCFSLCICSVLPVSANTGNETSTDVYIPLVEPENICTATIDEHFCGYYIDIVLRHEYSGFNKRFDYSDFPELSDEPYEVMYLTKLKDPNTTYAGIDVNTYQQQFRLCFFEDDKANILECIKKLEANPKIYKASPCYYGWWPQVMIYDGCLASGSYPSAADALKVLQYSVGKIPFTLAQEHYADLNYDDKITSNDALLILQIVVGKRPLTHNKQPAWEI